MNKRVSSQRARLISEMSAGSLLLVPEDAITLALDLLDARNVIESIRKLIDGVDVNDPYIYVNAAQIRSLLPKGAGGNAARAAGGGEDE